MQAAILTDYYSHDGHNVDAWVTGLSFSKSEYICSVDENTWEANPGRLRPGVLFHSETVWPSKSVSIMVTMHQRRLAWPNHWARCCLRGPSVGGAVSSRNLRRSSRLLLDQVPHLVAEHVLKELHSVRISRKPLPTSSVSLPGVCSHGCLSRRYTRDCHLFF